MPILSPRFCFCFFVSFWGFRVDLCEGFFDLFRMGWVLVLFGELTDFFFFVIWNVGAGFWIYDRMKSLGFSFFYFLVMNSFLKRTLLS